jgi:integrase
MWREPATNGEKSRQRKIVVGDKKQYPTKSAALKAVEALKLDINASTVSKSSMTIAEVAMHYITKELGEDSKLTAKTVEVYLDHLNLYILPRWGTERIGSVLAFRVEDWLSNLKVSDGSKLMADGTKAKTRAVFSCLYKHALRYGWAERNPISEVRQSAKPHHEPDILTEQETAALMVGLPDHARAMVTVAAVTGLRRSEVIGLKWEDINFDKGKLHVRRSVVEGQIGEPKTKASKRALPLSPALSHALSQWRQQTSYSKDSDWVFASPTLLGRMPAWPGMVLEDHIRPAALEAGISKCIGWHTYRRSIATWLQANGETVKTTQELLRHASPVMTLGTYAQAIGEDKYAAQATITVSLGLAVPA